MGAIKKLFSKARSKTRPGGTALPGSEAITGIGAGDAGSNTGGGSRGTNRRPGRRGTDTPLGPNRRRM